MSHEIDATFLGLHKWYCHLVKKLGWMVLAQQHGNTAKIAVYKKSIDDFLKAVSHKKSYIKCDDKKHDLDLMEKNITFLKTHVDADFPSIQAAQGGGARRGSRKGSRKGSKGRK